MKQVLWAWAENSEEQQGLERDRGGLPTRMTTSFQVQLLRLHSWELQRPTVLYGYQKQFSQKWEWKISFSAAFGRRYVFRAPQPPRHSLAQHREPTHKDIHLSHRSSCPWEKKIQTKKTHKNTVHSNTSIFKTHSFIYPLQISGPNLIMKHN